MAPKWQPRAAQRAAVDGVYSPAMNPQPPPERLMGRNSDFAWDSFDSCSYLTHNYGTLRDDDRQIVEGVRDFFAPLDPAMVRQGLDVGSGTNLYPALTMLPLCDKITLWEYASSNVRWLRREVRRYSQSWDGFWDLLSQDPLYKSVEDPRAALVRKALVRKGSIFDLPVSRWDVGTMFFVAESISADVREFQAATQRFVRSLKPGAPFAAAFMKNSTGYDVGDRRFPAVAVDVDDVHDCLAGSAEDVKIERISAANPLRTGYDGMILALGKAK